jgi:hypothetical protein
LLRARGNGNQRCERCDHSETQAIKHGSPRTRFLCFHTIAAARATTPERDVMLHAL